MSDAAIHFCVSGRHASRPDNAPPRVAAHAGAVAISRLCISASEWDSLHIDMVCMSKDSAVVPW
jgi:hypothetical protein